MIATINGSISSNAQPALARAAAINALMRYVLQACAHSNTVWGAVATNPAVAAGLRSAGVKEPAWDVEQEATLIEMLDIQNDALAEAA